MPIHILKALVSLAGKEAIYLCLSQSFSSLFDHKLVFAYHLFPSHETWETQYEIFLHFQLSLFKIKSRLVKILSFQGQCGLKLGRLAPHTCVLSRGLTLHWG